MNTPFNSGISKLKLDPASFAFAPASPFTPCAGLSIVAVSAPLASPCTCRTSGSVPASEPDHSPASSAGVTGEPACADAVTSAIPIAPINNSLTILIASPMPYFSAPQR